MRNPSEVDAYFERSSARLTFDSLPTFSFYEQKKSHHWISAGKLLYYRTASYRSLYREDLCREPSSKPCDKSNTNVISGTSNTVFVTMLAVYPNLEYCVTCRLKLYVHLMIEKG